MKESISLLQSVFLAALIVALLGGMIALLILDNEAQNAKNKQFRESAERWEAHKRDLETPKERVVWFNDLTTGTVLVSDNDYPMVAQIYANMPSPRR